MLSTSKSVLLLSFNSPAPSELLASELTSRFGLRVNIHDAKLPVLATRDGQVSADELLRYVEKEMANSGCGIALGVTGVDLFMPGMNFVFGLASGAGAVISVFRLESADPATHRSRILKEALHEMGHVWGLPHCTKSLCVMHFSNSLSDTDLKGTEFCRDCASRLEALASMSGIPSQL